MSDSMDQLLDNVLPSNIKDIEIIINRKRLNIFRWEIIEYREDRKRISDEMFIDLL